MGVIIEFDPTLSQGPYNLPCNIIKIFSKNLNVVFA